MKVRKGTRNYLHEAAMTETEMELCLERGAEVVRRCREEGSNILSFGEMGIGNTSSSSLWMSCFTGIPLKECVGAGSGLDDAGIRHKYEVLNSRWTTTKETVRRVTSSATSAAWKWLWRKAPCCKRRAENDYSGRRLHHDKLYPCRCQAVSRSATLCRIRTLRR